MIYRNKIKELVLWKSSSTRKPLILQGARQVGKTSLIKEFGNQYFSKTFYFNFEEDRGLHSIFAPDLDPKRILNQLSLSQGETITTSDLIVFDEIQACPLAITSLKYFCEKMPQLYLIAAGSLLGLHFNSSFPVGKVSFVDLYPLNFEEFLLAIGEDQIAKLLQLEGTRVQIASVIHQKIWTLLKTYFIVGGMPEVVDQYRAKIETPVDAFNISRIVQLELIRSYTNDIAKHSGKTNAMNIERVWRSVPDQLARSQDGSAQKFKFKGVLSGQKSYRDLAGPLDWLQKAGIVLRTDIVNSGLSPSSAYAKDNRFKLYLHDIGLLGAMAKLEPRSIFDWDFGTYKGYFAENYVAEELICRGFSLYSWEEATAEVEFLISHDGKTVPIEVKSGQSVGRVKSLAMFELKYHPESAIVFSANVVGHGKKHRLNLPLYLTSFFGLE